MENNRQVKKGMILAGGLGTRFLPQTLMMAKELLPIGNEPILLKHLKELKNAGITDILIVGNKLKENDFRNLLDPPADYLNKLEKDKKLDLLKDYFALMDSLQITYINQDDRYQQFRGEFFENPNYDKMGSAIAILAGINWANGEPFVVMNGDDLCEYSDGKSASKELVEIYEATGDNIIYGRECPQELMYKYSSMRCGNAVANGKGKKMDDIIEKPAPGTEPSNIMGFGRYIVNNDFFENIFNIKPRGAGEYNMTDVFQQLARQGKVSMCLFKGKYFDCGSQSGYIAANYYYGRKDKTIENNLVEQINDVNKIFDAKSKEV